MKTNIPSVDPKTLTTYEHQLFQICNGPVWDGDLISKHNRDVLVDSGYAGRVGEWNIITAIGLEHWFIVAERHLEQTRLCVE